jgi:hypothetical protein
MRIQENGGTAPRIGHCAPREKDIDYSRIEHWILPRTVPDVLKKIPYQKRKPIPLTSIIQTSSHRHTTVLLIDFSGGFSQFLQVTDNSASELGYSVFLSHPPNSLFAYYSTI